ncbi:MAG: ABC transporter permease [Chloroflexota bacterium]|nr:ABC transporter permease [Chloroflexota bacterium]
MKAQSAGTLLVCTIQHQLSLSGVTLSKYILKRLVQLIPVLIGVSLLVFIMVRLIPGDPADVMLGDRGTAEAREQIRVALGLDKPLYEQYIIFINRLIRGDLGDSFVLRRPAMPMILERFPRTLFLTIYGVVLSVIVALPLAILSALKKDTLVDHVIRGFVTLTLSMPSFWIALLLIITFSVKLHIFPIAGFGNNLKENLYYLFLPALSIALSGSAVLVRNLRAVILDVLQSDYVRTANAKGLTPTAVFVRHVLRNSLISTVTLLGLRVAYSVGGAVIVETIFAIPGLGRLLVNSISARDYPVVQAITLFLAVLVIVVNLVTDIIYAVLDPRIQYE